MVTAPAKPAPPMPRPSPRIWCWPLVIAGLSLTLSLALTWFAWRSEHERDRGRFDNVVQRIHAAIEARLELHVGMLRAAAGLFAASENITEEEFRAFALRIDLQKNYPGAQGMGFARRVEREALAGFLEERRKLAPGFPALFPSGERDEYFPIIHLVPQDRRNTHALGYDMFNEPLRRAAMERARDRGDPATTAPVILVQEIDDDKQTGFLVYVPIYHGGAVPRSIEERRARLLGFVYSPFRVDDLFGGLHDAASVNGICFEVHAGADPISENPIFRPAEEERDPPEFHDSISLRVADRDWTVLYRDTPAFDTRSTRSLTAMVGAGGLVLSLAMGVIAFALARSIHRAQKREREMFLQKEQLRVTLASIGDAVICTDAESRVMFLNPVAEQLTGWPLAEARGRLLHDIVPLLNEDTGQPVGSPVEEVLRRGSAIGLANHTILVSRSGKSVPIEDSAAPIRTGRGALAGVVLVFHDVTAKRHSEAALRQRERLLAAVAGGAAVGLAIIRRDGEYAFANDAFARAFGRTESEIVGRGAAEVAGSAWEEINLPLDQALGGTPASGEFFLPAAGDPRQGARCFAANFEPQGIDHERTVVVVMLDITERKRAEEELQVGEERHRLALDAGRLGAWDYDPRSQRLIWDPRCRRLLGVPPDVKTGFSLLSSVLHPDDRERVFHALHSALQPGGAGHCDVECRVMRPNDRAERWIRATGKAYFDPGGRGRARRFIGTVQDITEDKRKEDALHFLLELGAATQALTDPDEILRITARMLGEHLGADRCAYAEVEDEKILVITGDHSRGVPSIVGRRPLKSFGAESARLMRANTPFIVVDTEADPRITPADLPAYRATNIRACISVPLHKAGKFSAAMSVHQTRPRRWSPEEIDLVEMVVARCWESIERGRAIREIQESERRLRFMAESMPHKIFTTRADGSVDYLSRQWVEFAGESIDRIRDWGWVDIIHPDDRAENLRRWKHSVATGEPFQIEHRIRRHDGEYRWHLTRATPLRGRGGEISMWIGSNTDITDIVQARETLAERRRELERLVDERTASLRKAVEQMEEFSYSISHDLRAPLRAMQGYAQALLEDYADRLDAEGVDYLRRISAASSRMDRLTLDVLTYSKVARESIRPQRVSLDRLVSDCMRQHLDFRSGDAAIEIEHPLPDVVGHEPLLMQVVSNLVSNALKFVRPSVAPRVKIWAETRDSRVRLFVEDNGIGIRPQHQKRIWGMFEQAHPQSGYGGTGIGLAIVRKAMERMDGQAGVESDGHSGSRFWIELPAPPRAEPPPPGGS